MEKEKRIKNKIKIALIAIAMVVFSLMIILIVQTVQLHRLEKQKASASHELVELEEKSEELTDPEHNKKYYEQEKNYGGEKDYIF